MDQIHKRFTAGAIEEAQEAGSPVILIDADKLLGLLVEARLGIKAVVERAVTDEEYFASLER